MAALASRAKALDSFNHPVTTSLAPHVEALDRLNRAATMSLAPQLETLDRLNWAATTSLAPQLGTLDRLNRAATMSLAPQLETLDRLNRAATTSLAPQLGTLDRLNRAVATSLTPYVNALDVQSKVAATSTLVFPPRILRGSRRPVHRPASTEFATGRRLERTDAVPSTIIVDLEPGSDHSECYVSEKLEVYDELITDPGIRGVTRRLFANGHYAIAVEKAFVYVNNMVKQKSKFKEKDGASLMREVFSAKSPVLMLNDFQSQSDRDEQQGYMDIYVGAMIGIRNPHVHEHDLDDKPDSALEMIVLANHLMRRLKVSRLSQWQM